MEKKNIDWSNLIRFHSLMDGIDKPLLREYCHLKPFRRISHPLGIRTAR